MGNRFSLQQAEDEEAEYQALVATVNSAQRGKWDIEANAGDRHWRSPHTRRVAPATDTIPTATAYFQPIAEWRSQPPVHRDSAAHTSLREEHDAPAVVILPSRRSASQSPVSLSAPSLLHSSLSLSDEINAISTVASVVDGGGLSSSRSTTPPLVEENSPPRHRQSSVELSIDSLEHPSLYSLHAQRSRSRVSLTSNLSMQEGVHAPTQSQHEQASPDDRPSRSSIDLGRTSRPPSVEGRMSATDQHRLRHSRSRSRSRSRSPSHFSHTVIAELPYQRASQSPSPCVVIPPPLVRQWPSPQWRHRINVMPQTGNIEDGYPQDPAVVVPPTPTKTANTSARVDAEPGILEMVKDIHDLTKRVMDEYGAEEEEVKKSLLEELRTLRHRMLARPFPHREPSGRNRFPPPDQKSERGSLGTPVYPNIAFAAGIGLPQIKKAGPPSPGAWGPVWDIFPLKAFRGSDFRYMKINAGWDDEQLLREIGRTYDALRTIWRKWFSLKGVSAITMVLADHSFVYPQRLGPAKVSPVKNMRLRYLLQHPQCMKSRHEFMEVLTARTDVGIEFVERFQISRIAIAIVLPVVLSALLGIFYSIFLQDVSSAFTVAGYMTSAYSVCLVLIGVLNLVES